MATTLALICSALIAFVGLGVTAPTAHAEAQTFASLPAETINSLVHQQVSDESISVTSMQPSEDLVFDPAVERLFKIGSAADIDHAQTARGYIVQRFDKVLVAVYSSDRTQLVVTALTSDGRVLGSQNINAGLSECQTVGGVLVLADVYCLATGPGAVVCGLPLTFANFAAYIGCNFDATYTVNVTRNQQATSCRYGAVSGQYYTRGGLCDLTYMSERGPIRDFPNTPRANITNVSAYLRFFRNDSGLDIGANIFENNRFSVETVVAGVYHNIKTRSSLQTGTSDKPRYCKVSLYVSYSDGSYVSAQDAIIVD